MTRKSAAESSKKLGPEVGMAVFLRTVTMYYTGRIAVLDDEQIVLEEPAWIADTGRLSTFLRDGTASEVEPFPSWVAIPRGCIVDISPWQHALMRKVK